MRKTTICLLVLLCSIAAFGQKQPQWKVVQSVILTRQSAPIQQSTLFTPTKPGLYRLSAYMSGGGQGPGYWVMQFSWTDITGLPVYDYSLQIGIGKDAAWTQLSPIFISIQPGKPFTYQIDSSGDVSNTEYNFAITIEQLQ